MADKQTGTGARGTGHKPAEGKGDDATKNPVSAKNRSKQKKSINRSTLGGNPGRGPRESD